MKLELSYHSGFSGDLFGWGATMLVGRPGKLSCTWFDGEGHDRTLKRHDFGLSALLFLRVFSTLSALPSPLQELNADDAPVRRIRATSESGVAERSFIPRFGGKTPTQGEEEFNRLWVELVGLVGPAFLKLE